MMNTGIDSYLSINPTTCSLRAQLTTSVGSDLDGQLSNRAASVDRMATCPDCQREMRLAPSCVTTFAVVVENKAFDRVRHPASATEPCDSCGVKSGGVHHFGRDMERCPACGGQLIMCVG